MSTEIENEVVVCKADELNNGKRKLVAIRRMNIVVLKSNDKLYAFNNMCPHQGAPLEFGSISGAMQSSDAHQYEYGCHNEIVRCPLHGWGFNMETGQSLFSDKLKIRAYKVREENGVILLSVKGNLENVRVTDVQEVCGSAEPKVKVQ